MQKVMFSLWKPVGLSVDCWRDALMVLGGALPAEGVWDVSLMVVDSDVARAAGQRMTVSAEPLDGMLSLWIASTTLLVPIEAALAQHVARWHSYHVEECVPNHARRRALQRPTSGAEAGSMRVPGMCQLALFQRPAWLNRAQWLRLWRDSHGFNAYALQSIFDCRQNVVIAALSEGAPEVHAIVEEHYPDAAIGDVDAFYGANGDAQLLQQREEALSESVCSFVDLATLDCILTSFYQVSETR